MSEWICESCIYYPPSSCDGKPCCVCDPYEPTMNCYCKKEKEIIPDCDKCYWTNMCTRYTSIGCCHFKSAYGGDS